MAYWLKASSCDPVSGKGKQTSTKTSYKIILDLNMLKTPVMFIWQIKYLSLYLTYLLNRYQDIKRIPLPMA